MTIDYGQKKVTEIGKYVRFPDNSTDLLWGKKKNNVKFSIVIPTYKRERTLRLAIKSAIEQETHEEYEVVVLDNDDNQSDYSILEMIKEFFSENDLCYYKNRNNLGMTGNWNLAIQVATGKYIVILHDDDKLHSNYIDTMSEILRIKPEIGLIGCRHQEISDEDMYKESFSDKTSPKVDKIIFREENAISSFFQHSIHICGLLFDREKAIKVGGFDDFWYPCSDYVFEMRLLEKYGGVLCENTLADYRVLDNESFNPLIAGRFPIVIYLAQGELNERYKVLPKVLGEQYRSAFLNKYEKDLLKQWCKNNSDKLKLELELKRWRDKYHIDRIRKYQVYLFKIIQNSVRLYMRYFKTEEIKRYKS